MLGEQRRCRRRGARRRTMAAPTVTTSQLVDKPGVRSATWMKMIFRILLLISFISCVSGSLVVNVTQTHYQAEQNHSITLEWTFTPKPDVSITSVYIICQLVTDLRASVLFHLHEGVEVSKSQDQQFSGRVQFNRDELREGRLRLQMSRLRTDDSGRYDCSIRTSDGWNTDVCRLNVTAAVDQHKAQTTVSPEPGNRGRTGLYAALVLFVCVLLFCFSIVLSILNLWKTDVSVFDQEVSYTHKNTVGEQNILNCASTSAFTPIENLSSGLRLQDVS